MGPTRVEEDFGNSVRAMRQQQVMDPVAAATVDTTPVTSTDGQRMERVLETYRQSVGEPQEVSKPITFEVSQ